MRTTGLAEIQYTNRQLAGAIDSHHHALRLRPDFAFVHNDLGNALADISGRDDEVLHHYTEAARLLPEFAEAQSNVGTLLKEMQRYPEAAATFEKAIRVKPVLCEAYKNLGSCQQGLGRPSIRCEPSAKPRHQPAVLAGDVRSARPGALPLRLEGARGAVPHAAQPHSPRCRRAATWAPAPTSGCTANSHLSMRSCGRCRSRR